MKQPGKIKNTSTEQDKIIAELTTDGYLALVRDRWQDAFNVLVWYLEPAWGEIFIKEQKVEGITWEVL
jgi:hypothetical protein